MYFFIFLLGLLVSGINCFNKDFYIEHIDSGRVLEIQNANRNAFAKIILNPLVENRVNQIWVDKEDGLIHSKLNNLVLEACPSTNEIITYHGHGGNNQRWVEQQGNIWKTKDNRVMGIPSGSASDNLQMYAFTPSRVSLRFRKKYVFTNFGTEPQ